LRAATLWTGKEEWRLKLDGAGYGPAISADVDGDGKGEFLIGDYCLGTNAQGKGEVRRRSGILPTGWSIIADLDGDGLEKSSCPEVTVLCECSRHIETDGHFGTAASECSIKPWGVRT